jgi:hypothetical protein
MTFKPSICVRPGCSNQVEQAPPGKAGHPRWYCSRRCSSRVAYLRKLAKAKA